MNASLQTSNTTLDNEAERTTESMQYVPTGTPKVATAAPKKKAWVKTESRKGQLEKRRNLGVFSVFYLKQMLSKLRFPTIWDFPNIKNLSLDPTMVGRLIRHWV